MDVFVSKLDEFLNEKTTIVKQYIQECEKEKRELRGNIVEEAGMTYDMHKFLKTVREFEEDRKKKSKKRVKDNVDI